MPDQEKLSKAINACAANARRLIDDAECELASDATRYMLAKLSQEESAKALILILVRDGALSWSNEVRRSLNHHHSKQLIGILLDYINPEIPDSADAIMQFFKSHRISTTVADAINLYVHEILKRWESNDWLWLDAPHYDADAKKIFEGLEDKRKQSSVYISIAKDGSPIETPKQFNEHDVTAAIEDAKRYYQAVNGSGLYYKQIRDLFAELAEEVN